MQRQPWVNVIKTIQTLKGLPVRGTLSGFNAHLLYAFPGLSLRSNSWAQISQHLRRILNHSETLRDNRQGDAWLSGRVF